MGHDVGIGTWSGCVLLHTHSAPQHYSDGEGALRHRLAPHHPGVGHCTQHLLLTEQ